ncbi:hypothetical protein [Fluviispira multicolorata]|uniref:Outer membrane protein beta-barrel domain-containing protein n=1 Tax=Fluviispira multicolorata TaxID=2654512 RepID=A0A833N2Z5_9BACT|nr:hypothetical protein [Fluviispira multicolorata]KAB8033398.1 hypothetical protein GCL57_01475 [Fluviispira multicolorata]
MDLKRIILLIVLIFSWQNSFALGSNSDLDILTGIGITRYNENSDDLSPISNAALTGINLNGTLLFPINNGQFWAPVFGGGMTFSALFGKENIGTYNSSTVFMSSLFLIANGGLKFGSTPSFSLYTLVNLGYSLYDKHSAEIETIFSTYHVDTEIKNHYLYGINIIGMFEKSKNFNMGGGFIFNRHSMRYNSFILLGKEPTNIGIDTTFDEYSFNFLISFNF